MAHQPTFGDDELVRINSSISKIEESILRGSGLHRISGGFVTSHIAYFDDNAIVVKVKYGCVSDCVSSVSEGEYKMDRRTYNLL